MGCVYLQGNWFVRQARRLGAVRNVVLEAKATRNGTRRNNDRRRGVRDNRG